MGVDRISNLPLELTHKILECLPIKEAVKTSVLSQQWRFKWASIPQLILDDSFVMSILERGNFRNIRFITQDYIRLIYSNAVNNILFSRVGPISKFALYIPSWLPGETYMWLRYVCANAVNDLSLQFDIKLKREVPKCVFTCSGLTHLTLIECKLLSLPPTFKSFPHLIYLKISSWSTIETKALKILISKCPQLETLHLAINEPENLTIYAPKLKNLFVDGYLHILRLAETNKAAIKTINLNDIFKCLANVEHLVLDCDFWEEFDYSRKVQSKLKQLRTLKLVDIPLRNQSQLSFFLRLFESIPQLEQLSIQVSDIANGVKDNTIQMVRYFTFEFLREVQLLGISGCIRELQLIKYIQAHSPVLENMTIELHKNMGVEQKYNFASEAMQYCRASPTAKIIIIKDKQGS